MKKLAGILAVLMLLTMLGGCYKSDTTVDLDLNGAVEVTSTIVGIPEMYQQIGIGSPDDILKEYSEETLAMVAQMYGMAENGERLELSRIDAAGNEIPEGTALPTDGSMVGTRLRMKYNSMSDAVNSFTLMNFLRTTPLTQDDSGYGLTIEEKRTMLGTKYIASGKIGVYGSEMYKAEYDSADEAFKEKISQASTSITFKFPLAVSKSNADTKGFLGQSLTWSSTVDAAEKEVYFEVFAINPLVLGMAVVILILLIALIIVACKKRDKGPDAIFVDEEGNPIPVYDEEAEDAEEGETAEEFEAVEVAEDAEADSEVTVVLEEVTEEAASAEEDTEETDK